MRSKSGSSFSTFLLSLPLVGVPLMAVFGVPQFVPVVASSVRDPMSSRPWQPRSALIGESLVPTSFVTSESTAEEPTTEQQPLDDLFRPQAKSRSATRRLQSSTIVQSDTRMTSGPRSETDSESDGRVRSEEIGLGFLAEKSVNGLTWRKAVERLNELGIQEFRLEPGQKTGEFYFACEFSPDHNARITRRFESEASEPLKAVAQVLQQIDAWMPQR